MLEDFCEGKNFRQELTKEGKSGELNPFSTVSQAISLSQVILPVSPSQWAFKVIKLKKLPVEDLPLAPWFLTYSKRHAVVTFVVCAVVCAGRMDRKNWPAG
jgi:hypothetical protein